jgi:hypothetical protein
LKLSEHRSLLAPICIALAVCAGGYVLTVEPRERQLRDLNAVIAAQEVKHAATQRVAPDVARLHAMLAEATSAANRLRTKASVITSESMLFESIMSLAGDAGVRVESMTPAGGPTRAPAPAAVAPVAPIAGAAPAQAPPEDRQLRYTLDIIGEYDDIVRFVERLQGSMGLTSVRAVRVSSNSQPGQRSLTATVQTEHLILDPRSVVALRDAEVNP